MSKLSEEEIIDEINFCNEGKYITREHYQAIQGLLDLYQKEKEKNKEIKERIEYYYSNGGSVSIVLNDIRELLEERN